MKILFIHNRYQQAGGEDVAFQLEVGLLRQHHDVDVLHFSNDHILTLWDKISSAAKSVYNFFSFRTVISKISTFKPDVIHVHNLFFSASPSILIAAYKKKVPVVVTLHNYRLICANALLLRNNQVCELCVNKTLPLEGIKYKCYRSSSVQSGIVTAITGVHKIVKTWNRCVSQYICLTEFSKSKILFSSLQLKEQQIQVIPNFVPDITTGIHKKGDFFLYVGRISKEKGVEVLLKAFLKIPGQSLLIVGDGPEKLMLEEKYRNAVNISFLGQKDKASVLGLMAQCQALLFPSLCYENLPFTIIEAFSAGTPVIASRLGAMLEVIRNGYNGFHFTPGSHEELEAVVLKFVQLNEEEQKVLYKQARRSYEEKFHPDAHYKALINVYEKAIKKIKNDTTP